MNWKCVATIGLCLMACLSLDASAANLVSNGSFEDPGGGNLVPNPPGISAFYITGWEVYTGDIDYIPPSTWTASDPVMSLDLHGFNPGGIRQTIATVPGETYKVIFDMAANPSGSTLKELRVSAAGSSAQFTFDRTGKTTTNMGWETKGWSFVATSTSTVLSFESVGSYPSNAGPALDNVRVSTIVIAGPDLSLASASSNWSFDGFQLAPWRTAIEDPSNFGLAGTVQIEIVTLNLSSITPATLANVDVFVSPWWAASESAPFHSTIQSFFLSGGHLFLLQDSPGRDGIGALLGIPSTSSTGSVSNGGAPLFDGPFGTAVNITQHGSVGQVTDVLSNNGTVAGTNVQGQVTAAIWNPGDYVAGAGSMVILGDVDMISSSFGGAQFNPPNDKGRFALNTTAFLASAG